MRENEVIDGLIKIQHNRGFQLGEAFLVLPAVRM